MKRFLTIALMICMCLAIGVFADEAKPVTVTLNGETVDCASYGQEATIVEGRTLVPLRAIFEALGASVEWNAETRTVDSKLGETEISLTIGENKLIKNGEEIALDVPAMIMNGRTLVPVRAVSESFGVAVEWDGENRVVVLNMDRPFGKFMFDMSKEEALAVIEGKTEVYDTRIDIWDEEGIYNDDDGILFGEEVNCEYISLDFYKLASGYKLDVITARTASVSLEEAEKTLENLKGCFSGSEEYGVYDDGGFYSFNETECWDAVVYGGIIKDENSDKYFCYVTMSPMSFGGIRKVDKTGRLVYMNWHHAYGDFYFGMTKEDVLECLPGENASVYKDEISILLPEECGKADNGITGDADIETIDFEFENGKLQKMVLFTDYGARGECLETLENMTEYYGEPTDKKKGDEEYIWVVDGGNVKVTATVYCLENTLLIDPNYGYYVEIQIRYTGNAFGEPEEKEDEAESEEKEYIYGKFYFGMKYDEALEVSGRPEDGDDKPSEHKNSEGDVSYITLKDTNAKYADEDESITGKVNVERFELGFAKERLYDIFISTDYAMTREEADAVLTGLIELYKEPSISIDSLQNYEWVSDKVQIKLDIFKKTTEENGEAFGINLRYTKGGFKKDVKFNILDQMPLGLELQRVMKAFEARVEQGENRIEFFDVYDPAIHELRSYTTINGFYGNASFNTVKEPYRPEKDIFGQNFKCNYISLDLVDGVYDNCFVRTGASYRASAVETMKYVAKYLGLENAVFDEENLRYEWKDYNFRGKNGISKVNIYSGIAEAEYDRYYCYISIQIADNGRYSFVDEEGRIAGYDYPHAYGNLYFGMTVEQALEVIKGENKVSDDACRIDVYDKENVFDDEDKNITGNINFESMSVLFDSEKKTLYKVSGVSSALTSEQVQNVLESLREYYGNEDDVKEMSGVTSYSWAVRGKNSNVCFDVAESEDGFVCTYAVTFAGSR